MRTDIRKMSRKPTPSEKASIEDRRQKLNTRLGHFNTKAERFLGEQDMDEIVLFCGVDDRTGLEDEDEEWFDDKEEDDEGPEWPEHQTVCMPSAFSKQDIQQLHLEDLALQELQLRQGQANDTLEKLRTALGRKSLLFRKSVRKAHTTKGKTRAWDEVNRTTAQILKYVRGYRRARQAMERLGAEKSILEKYKEIKDEDLKMSSDLIEENRFGQKNDVMAWFWKIDGQKGNQDDKWMLECMYCIVMFA